MGRGMIAYGQAFCRAPFAFSRRSHCQKIRSSQRGRHAQSSLSRLSMVIVARAQTPFWNAIEDRRLGPKAQKQKQTTSVSFQSKHPENFRQTAI